MNRKLLTAMAWGMSAYLACAQMPASPGQFPAMQGEMADDSLRTLAGKVASYARKTPQEIVSVHMDNNCYFLGDTIWYKAYVLREGKMAPSDISGVLYAELINQDGYMVERQTLRLCNGMASGSFCLSDTAYAGYYELRAYTRWQLNWGEHEHPHSKATSRWFLSKDMAREFYRDYDKLYSRVFPVYDKPGEAGDYSQVMSLRPLRRHYKLRKERPDAEVTLYPEGGAWVDGVEQRLAFEAYNEVVDAGLMPAWLPGSLFFSLNLGRLYIGDMGISRAYDLERRWSGHTASFFTDIREQLRYNHLCNLDKVLIYTDYSPRLEGDRRYQATNQPSVTVNLVALPDNMVRPTNRDRQYVRTGYNTCEDFYHPHYEQRPLPRHADYRRTLYWNPDLKLDSNGEASITLWGNSHECEPAVSVEGISTTGRILSGGKAQE